MANFVVSVSNVKPKTGKALKFQTGYTRCGQYKGTPPAASDVMIACGNKVKGRYVYLYRPVVTDKLYFTEVSVYGDSK